MKMVTSSKFRFPTTDYNEKEKEMMRVAENKIREQVSSSGLYDDNLFS